ncbi:MAG: Mo-dependent nitrogenase C-terminal domain-containing protein [Gloeomargarita sp. DG_1_4_bins_134]
MTTTVFPLPQDWLFPLRQALNGIEIRNSRMAHFLCRLIPSRCPFERTFYLGKYRIYIPPLCRLNPLYEEVVALRMRALDYLNALEVDVSPYLEE